MQQKELSFDIHFKAVHVHSKVKLWPFQSKVIDCTRSGHFRYLKKKTELKKIHADFSQSQLLQCNVKCVLKVINGSKWAVTADQ